MAEFHQIAQSNSMAIMSTVCPKLSTFYLFAVWVDALIASKKV